MSTLADRAHVSPSESRCQEQRSSLALQSERKLVLEQSSKYPVLTLPTEIIIEVFMHFLPTYPLCPPLTGLDSPTLLTQICHEWREIALGTATLWRAILLNDHTIPFERQAHLCNMWLSRSLFHPLSIDIYEDIVNPLRTAELLSALVLHRARWQHLNLRRLSISLLRMIEGPMPLLRSLNLFLTDYELDLITTANVVFREAHLLRTVVLNDYAAEYLTLPWAQLTALTLRGVFPRECVPVLQHASNLVHCELNLVNESVDTPDITLPSLQSLTLTGRSVTGYLETLIVPALLELEIPESFLGPNSIDTLTSFMSKSRCKLRALCITQYASVSRDLFYKAFPLIAVCFEE
ncbi:hypothetical protein B0H14DRAFT_629186 [Mycena olivaceomarginata]|nr:hypothetical protein B0H14DRAFT_629186 [Mycena olivaceomarginata]